MTADGIRIVTLLIALLPFSGMMILFGLPMMRGEIEPNDFMGCRTRKTKSDPEIWYRVNARVGRLMVWSGAMSLVPGLGLFFIKSIHPMVYWGIVMGMMLIICIAMTVVMFVEQGKPGNGTEDSKGAERGKDK